MTELAQKYDVLIAGGGLSGCAAAITLQRAGLRTLIVERLKSPCWKPGESLPPVSRRLLSDLGISDHLPANATRPIYANQACWEADSINAREFMYDPDGHGWRVDRAALEVAAQHAARYAGAQLLQGVRMPFLQRSNGHWSCKINEQPISAPWIVDASGRSRHIARRCGARVQTSDKQIAIVGCLRAASADDNDTSTLVEAVESGWFYTALLPDHSRVIAYHTDRDLRGYSQARTQTGLNAILANTLHISPLLKNYGYTFCTPPQTTAANSSRLDKIHGPGWLAIGDAAVCFDPLSSQGMHTALYMGLRGAEYLVNRIGQDDESAFDQLVTRINTIYNTHLRHRQLSLDLVQRWPDSEYWQRRWSKPMPHRDNRHVLAG